MLRQKVAFQLSLCMIVRNEADKLAGFLQTHRSLADEIIVVDTGSTDGTVDLARAEGARVSEISWPNDFAQARNVSLEAARGNWVLVLDADEWIVPEDFEKVRGLCKGRQAWQFTTWTYSNDPMPVQWRPLQNPVGRLQEYRGYIPSDKVRLFPALNPDGSRVLFEGVIHELVDPGLVRADCPIRHAEVVVHHLPTLSLDPAKHRRKQQRYLALCARKAEAEPDNPKVFREWGDMALEMGQYADAALAYNQALEKQPEDPVVPVLLAASLLQLGRHGDVVALLEPRMPCLKESPAAWAALGEALGNRGDFANAEQAFLQSIALDADFFHALINLGVLYMQANLPRKAYRYFQEAASICPHLEISRTNLGLCSAMLGDLEEARQCFEESRRIAPDSWMAWFYLGLIEKSQGQYALARTNLEKALELHPENQRVQEELDTLP